jgi:hypothetical protein
MKRVSQTLLGLSAFLSQPASIDEFNSFLKGEGTALDYANDEAYYRGVAPKVRLAYLKLIEEKLNLSPKVESETEVGEGENKKVVKVYEKDTKFLKRIRAAGTTDEQLLPLLQQAFDDVGWDLSSTRNTGPSKKDVEAAEYYISAVGAGESTWDRIVGNFENANAGLSIAREADGSVSKDIMAEACKVNRIRLENSKML